MKTYRIKKLQWSYHGGDEFQQFYAGEFKVVRVKFGSEWGIWSANYQHVTKYCNTEQEGMDFCQAEHERRLCAHLEEVEASHE